jgi:hypothetical protein
MPTRAMFAKAQPGAGMYESFYLRAVSPTEPVGVWIRYTVHKRPGSAPKGSLWCTIFDARRGRPFQHKLTTEDLRVPNDGWIAVGDSVMGPAQAEGRCGPAAWSLRFSSPERELRHLAPGLLYRASLPRTKLTSPAPWASFDGVVELEGREPIELRDWPGMVGHNWGSEHAARWIWLDGMGFEQDPRAWLDVALGRIEIGGRMTPWVANGALSLDGTRYRVGGIVARGLTVREGVEGCSMTLAGRRGLGVHARVEVPPEAAAGWRYADPDGGEHDVINCSVCPLKLTVTLPGGRTTTLSTTHGGAYELGMREHDHGVPIAPFADC